MYMLLILETKEDQYDSTYNNIYEEEREPERLTKLIKNIAEKELTISVLRYKDKFPLETLDGYYRYEEEFKQKYPSGYDPASNYTFEDHLNSFALLAERVRADL